MALAEGALSKFPGTEAGMQSEREARKIGLV